MYVCIHATTNILVKGYMRTDLDTDTATNHTLVSVDQHDASEVKAKPESKKGRPSSCSSVQKPGQTPRRKQQPTLWETNMEPEKGPFKEDSQASSR